MPAMAAQRRLARGRGRAAGDGGGVALVRVARPVGTASRDSRARRTVPARHPVRCVPAAVLRRVPPLPAGHARRPTDHVRAGDRQRGECDRELDPHLRASGRAGARRRGRGLGHDDRPGVDGRVSVGRHSARASASSRSRSHTCRWTLDVARIKRLVASRVSGGVTSHARGRRLCRGDVAGRQARSGVVGLAPDRAQPGRAGLHGAARPVVGRRRARRSRHRRARRRSEPSSPAGRLWPPAA